MEAASEVASDAAYIAGTTAAAAADAAIDSATDAAFAVGAAGAVAGDVVGAIASDAADMADSMQAAAEAVQQQVAAAVASAAQAVANAASDAAASSSNGASSSASSSSGATGYARGSAGSSSGVRQPPPPPPPPPSSSSGSGSAAGRAEEIEGTKTRLVGLLASLDRGAAASKEQAQRVDTLASQLETLGGAVMLSKERPGEHAMCRAALCCAVTAVRFLLCYQCFAVLCCMAGTPEAAASGNCMAHCTAIVYLSCPPSGMPAKTPCVTLSRCLPLPRAALPYPACSGWRQAQHGPAGWPLAPAVQQRLHLWQPGGEAAGPLLCLLPGHPGAGLPGHLRR